MVYLRSNVGVVVPSTTCVNVPADTSLWVKKVAGYFVSGLEVPLYLKIRDIIVLSIINWFLNLFLSCGHFAQLINL